MQAAADLAGRSAGNPGHRTEDRQVGPVLGLALVATALERRADIACESSAPDKVPPGGWPSRYPADTHGAQRPGRWRLRWPWGTI
jgi:hypothetical protein